MLLDDEDVELLVGLRALSEVFTLPPATSKPEEKRPWPASVPVALIERSPRLITPPDAVMLILGALMVVMPPTAVAPARVREVVLEIFKLVALLNQSGPVSVELAPARMEPWREAPAEPLKTMDPTEPVVVRKVEGTVLRRLPAEALSDRLLRAERLPKTNNPSLLLELRLNAPEVVVMSPRSARGRPVVSEKPALPVAVRLPARIKLVVISPSLLLLLRLVANTPVLINPSLCAIVK